jgi:uncharacterized protein YidB (DUF937 family)
MSPMTMAILALLAWKAVKHMTAPGAAPASPQPAPPPAPANTGGLGGGLGDILKGPLGGLLGGAAAGSVISGGLGDLMKQLQQGGQGDAANSWVGKGPNKAVSPGDLASGSAPTRSIRSPRKAACRATTCSRASVSTCRRWSII